MKYAKMAAELLPLARHQLGHLKPLPHKTMAALLKAVAGLIYLSILDTNLRQLMA